MPRKKNEPIYVTRPSMPPLEEFLPYLEEIWKSKWLTNIGKFHHQFEQELRDFLGVKYISLFSNGTLALITALQAMRITGEVITTPFSFVASTHALVWNGIRPVFVDIEPDFMNIDPGKIEAAITPHTTAILPVHVFGNPCDLQKIQQIGDTYGLPVIYDACHAFGVRTNGDSVLNWGDLSILSFHATKVFTTFEGGAIVCQDEKMKRRIDFLKNFGFADEVTVVAPGINAKMNEVQAAFGLLQLRYVEEVIEKRKQVASLYRTLLMDIEGIGFLNDVPGVKHTYPYFPILIDSNLYGMSRDDVYASFRSANVYVRRYFYPLISQFPAYRGLPSASPKNLPTAERITREVLCLPIYPDLDSEIASEICHLLRYRFRKKQKNVEHQLQRQSTSTQKPVLSKHDAGYASLDES